MTDQEMYMRATIAKDVVIIEIVEEKTIAMHQRVTFLRKESKRVHNELKQKGSCQNVLLKVIWEYYL